MKRERIKPVLKKVEKWYYSMKFKNWLFEIIDTWNSDINNKWYLDVYLLNKCTNEKESFKYCLAHPTKKECMIQLEMMLNNEYLID